MSGDVSARAEPMIAALGEDIRPAVKTLERIFHDYDIGDATGCVYCSQFALFPQPEEK